MSSFLTNSGVFFIEPLILKANLNHLIWFSKAKTWWFSFWESPLMQYPHQSSIFEFFENTSVLVYCSRKMFWQYLKNSYKIAWKRNTIEVLRKGLKFTLERLQKIKYLINYFERNSPKYDSEKEVSVEKERSTYFSPCLQINCMAHRFGKNNNFFRHRIFFCAALSCFYRSEILFFVQHQLLLLTWKLFHQQQITFCATSNLFFRDKIIFCSTPNFCFGYCFECDVMVIYFYCHVPATYQQKYNHVSKKFILMWHKQINFCFLCITDFLYSIFTLHIGSMLI